MAAGQSLGGHHQHSLRRFRLLRGCPTTGWARVRALLPGRVALDLAGHRVSDVEGEPELRGRLSLREERTWHNQSEHGFRVSAIAVSEARACHAPES